MTEYEGDPNFRRDQKEFETEYRDYFKHSGNGSGFIQTTAIKSGGWQTAHFHKDIQETYIVQRGKVIFAQLLNGEKRLTLHEAGHVFTTIPRIIHNLYLYPNSVVHTVKYNPSDEDHKSSRGKLVKKFNDELNSLDINSIEDEVVLPNSNVVAVERLKDEMVGRATVPRDFAHRYGVPHGSVLIIPCRLDGQNKMEVLIQKRPIHKDVCPDRWDIFGGHIEVNQTGGGLFANPNDHVADQNLLKKVTMLTAIREANEELEIEGFQWNQSNLYQIGDFGDFRFEEKTSDHFNFEFSTLFVAILPKLGTVTAKESNDQSGTTEVTGRTKYVGIDNLISEYSGDTAEYADGISRVLDRFRDEETFLAEFKTFGIGKLQNS